LYAIAAYSRPVKMDLPIDICRERSPTSTITGRDNAVSIWKAVVRYRDAYVRQYKALLEPIIHNDHRHPFGGESPQG
jgi:hypothetical protein